MMAFLLVSEPQLAVKTLAPGGFIHVGVRFEYLGGVFYRGFLIRVEQAEHGFRQAGEVPLADGGLVLIGVTPLAIDGAEHLRCMVGIHKRTGAVINGLAADGHVIGVHDPVNKSDVHPVHV